MHDCVVSQFFSSSNITKFPKVILQDSSTVLRMSLVGTESDFSEKWLGENGQL